MSANGAKSENPLAVAIIGDAAALIKALEAGPIGRAGRVAHNPGVGMVAMGGVGIGSV